MKKVIILLVLVLTITSCGSDRGGYIATKENNSVILVSTETRDTIVIRSEDYGSSKKILDSINVMESELKDFLFSEKKYLSLRKEMK